MNINFFIGNSIGLFVFLFVFWRKLKEDYISSQVFSTSFSIVLGIVLFNILTRIFFPTWWFWASFLGVSIGYAVGRFRFKLRALETLQALIIALLPWLGLNFLANAVSNSNLKSFLCKPHKFRTYQFLLVPELSWSVSSFFRSVP